MLTLRISGLEYRRNRVSSSSILTEYKLLSLWHLLNLLGEGRLGVVELVMRMLRMVPDAIEGATCLLVVRTVRVDHMGLLHVALAQLQVLHFEPWYHHLR